MIVLILVHEEFKTLSMNYYPSSILISLSLDSTSSLQQLALKEYETVHFNVRDKYYMNTECKVYHITCQKGMELGERDIAPPFL